MQTCVQLRNLHDVDVSMSELHHFTPDEKRGFWGDSTNGNFAEISMLNAKEIVFRKINF